MDAPDAVTDRIRVLSEELGVALSIRKWWDNEWGSGYYCRAHGVLHDSPHVRIEVVCSAAINTTMDDVDLFILLNGVRVAPVTAPWHYLHRDGDGPFRVARDDEGYDVQTDLQSLLLSRKGGTA